MADLGDHARTGAHRGGPPSAAPQHGRTEAGRLPSAHEDGSARPPWHELEVLRPLTLRACRRIVVVAPHPRDEIRAAGGLLRRLGSRHAAVDVLSLTDSPTRTCTPPRGLPLTGAVGADAVTPGGTDAVAGLALDAGATHALRPDAAPAPDAAADVLAPGPPVPAAPFGPDAVTRPLTDLAHLPGLPGPGDLDHAGDLDHDDDLDDDDLDDDDLDDDGPEDWDPDEAAAAAAYRALGLVEVRRHRLGLPDGGVARSEADVVGAISEIVGFVDDPAGVCVLAPWSGDGDDDHEAAGRAAEVVTAAYRVRLVRWLDQAWSWAGPESAEVPWRRARQVALSETVLARKLAASAAFPDRPGHDRELPDGSAPGPREVFLV